MSTPRTPVAALLLASVFALVLAGCRADVRVEVDVHPGGGATTAVVVHLDEAATEWLAAADVDPVAIVSAAAVDPWMFDHADVDGLELSLRRDVEDAAELGDVLRGLSDGLTGEDPALLVDVDVHRPDRRTTLLVGEVEVRAPGAAAVRVDGRDVGPGADEFAAFAAEHVTARLVVRLPGDVVAHDGDRAVDGVEFDLTVGETRAVSVEAEAPGTSVSTWGVALVVVAGALAVVVAARIRSGRCRAAHGPVPVSTGE